MSKSTSTHAKGAAAVARWRNSRVRCLLAWSAVLLAGLSLLSPAVAQDSVNQPLSIEMPEGLAGGPEQWTSPEGLSSTLQVMLLLTVLSLAPAVLLMTTCFVRIVVVLGLLRQAIGTQQLAAQPGDHVAGAVHHAVDHDAGLEAGLRRGHRAVHRAGDQPGRGVDRRRGPDPPVHEHADRASGNSDDVYCSWATCPRTALPRADTSTTTTCRCRPCCRRSCSAS